MNASNLHFIGAGNIAMAIISGLLEKGVSTGQIRVSDPSEQQLERFTQLGITASNNNRAGIHEANLVVLSVKPDRVPEVAREIREQLSGECLVLSVAAGIPISVLESSLGYERAIVRCMPNTPALIQQAATGAYANSRVTDAQFHLTTALLEAIGIVVWVDTESQIDTVTAISGSGPAYFFLFAELMEQVAEEKGLSRDTARKLIIQTMAGAAGMMQATGENPANLRRKVTSPGGTTEAALKSLTDDRVEDMIRGAITAARNRSIELAGE